MPPTKKDKKRPQADVRGKGKGRGGQRFSPHSLSSHEEQDLWDAFCEERRAQKEEQERAATVRSVKNELIRTGLVTKVNAPKKGAQKRSKRQVTFSDEDEDDDEDSDFSSIGQQQLIDQVVDLKVELKDRDRQILALSAKATELQVLKAAAEKELADSNSSETAPRTLTMEQWQALTAHAGKVATPHASPVKGSLFGAHYEPDTTVIDSILAKLDEKLKLADSCQALTLGITVAAECNKSVEKVAATVVDTHFPAWKSGECHPGVKALLTRYKIDTTAKLTRTSIAAVLRAIASRKVHVIASDLHL